MNRTCLYLALFLMLALTSLTSTADGIQNPLQWLGLAKAKPTPTMRPEQAAAAPIAPLAVPAGVPQQFDLKRTRGVVVTAVAPNSPADEAGLQQGDVIDEVNRRPVHNVVDYRRAVTSAANQHEVLCLVERQGQTLFVTLSRSG